MGVFTALLVVGYGAVFCAALTQIVQTVRSRMSKKTYHFAMLAGISAQSVVRILLWSVLSSPKRWDSTVMLLMFLLPTWGEFACLALLPAYYAQTYFQLTQVSSKEQKKPQRYYIVTNVIMFVLFLFITIVITTPAASSSMQSGVNRFYILYICFSHILLAVLLAVYGRKFVSITKHKRHAKLLPRSPKAFKILNFTIIIIYILRSLFSFVNFFNAMPARDSTVNIDGHDADVAPSIFFFYFCMEIIPLSSVIILMWNATPSLTQTHSMRTHVGTEAMNKRLLDHDHFNPANPLSPTNLQVKNSFSSLDEQKDPEWETTVKRKGKRDKVSSLGSRHDDKDLDGSTVVVIRKTDRYRFTPSSSESSSVNSYQPTPSPHSPVHMPAHMDPSQARPFHVSVDSPASSIVPGFDDGRPSPRRNLPMTRTAVQDSPNDYGNHVRIDSGSFTSDEHTTI